MLIKRVLGVKVSLRDAESVRLFLKREGLLLKDCVVKREEGCVIFPIVGSHEFLEEYCIGEFDFVVRDKRVCSYKEVVRIPEKLQELLPSSFDVVGSIILIKLDDKLLDFKKEIGEALLMAHPQFATVCLVYPVSGEFRVRDVEVLAGDRSLRTVHREYGLFFVVDVGKVYFSPRLASERVRVAGLVGDGEVVVDLFAGVGPFSVMVGKRANPSLVVAVDKNRDAVELLCENILLNGVDGVVRGFCDDARNIVSLLDGRRVDRVIMNLPLGSFGFFGVVLSVLKDRGVVHFYEVLGEDAVEGRIEDLRGVAWEGGFEVVEVGVRKIKSYAPYEFYMCFDIVAQKMADVA